MAGVTGVVDGALDALEAGAFAAGAGVDDEGRGASTVAATTAGDAAGIGVGPVVTIGGALGAAVAVSLDVVAEADSETLGPATVAGDGATGPVRLEDAVALLEPAEVLEGCCAEDAA